MNLIRYLRYVLDRLARRIEPYCQDSWYDWHWSCDDCIRVRNRDQRIQYYETSRKLPIARLL